MASREEQAADVLEAGTGTVSAYTVWNGRWRKLHIVNLRVIYQTPGARSGRDRRLPIRFPTLLIT
jgi:hypothetical protein